MSGPPVQQKTEVLLICMPFASLMTPSIGLSLLKAGLARKGISAKVLYPIFGFARRVGVEPYGLIAEASSNNTYHMGGEWVFSEALFGSTPQDTEAYVEHILRNPEGLHCQFFGTASKKSIGTVLKMRDAVDPFLDETLSLVLDHQPRIVGFTSLCQQHMASLALAQRIKEHEPEMHIVFGGPNCASVMGMELVRQFACVDAVVSGEGDIVFPELVRRVLAGESLAGLQGVYTRSSEPVVDANGRPANAAVVVTLDDLPFPDYEDYFDQLRASHLRLPGAPSLLCELARGCWWGRCTFCSLNGPTKGYRAKSAQRGLRELTHLAAKHHGHHISLVDNVLNVEYFEDLLPRLARQRVAGGMFCEVRANLTKAQVRALRDANILTVQPGIESLSTPVLRLMRKGTTALENIQFLKWCKEFGLRPLYNLLCGLPGEPPEAYRQMADLVPWVTHLTPPEILGPIYLARFSPHFENPQRFGFANPEPWPAYRYIYRLDPAAIANLAYYFTYEYQEPQDPFVYTNPLRKAIGTWLNVHAVSDLFYQDDAAKIAVWDQRPATPEPLTVLTGLQRTLYLACDEVQTIGQLQDRAEQRTGETWSQDHLEELLQPILDRRLMVRDRNAWLSLAIPLGSYMPFRKSIEQFRRYLRVQHDLTRLEALMRRIETSDRSEDLPVSEEEISHALAVCRR